MSSHKKHHYNAEVYLKNFLIKNHKKLFIFDKRYPSYKEKGPGEIMFEDDFYSFINKEDKKDKSFETDVLGYIDNAITSVFQKIRELRLNEINGDDYNLIIQFTALQYVRGPKLRAEFEKYLKQHGLNLSKTEIRQAWLSKAFPKVIEVIDYIGYLPAVFVLSPENHLFITSDTPCTTEFSSEENGTQKFIPLSSRLGLLMMEGHSDKLPQTVQATKAHVDILNERVIKNSLRYIVASDMKSLEVNVQKTI